MTDDRRPKQRARSHMGDDERAAIGKLRRQSSPFGHPIHVDPEVTPPPQEPPRPDTLPGYGTINPVIRDQLDLLADGIGDVTRVLGKLWDTRHDSARIERLETKIDGYVKETTQHTAQIDQFVMPSLKTLMTRVDVLLTRQERHDQQLDSFFDVEWPRAEKMIAGLAKSIEDLVQRLGRLEHDRERIVDTATGLGLRLNTAENRDTTLDQRITALELRNRDADAGDKRQAKIFSLARVVLVAAAGVVGFIGSQLGNIADWFRK